MNTTARTINLLSKAGYSCTVVERYNSFIKQRFDAFGFGDVLACNPATKEILLVQTTTKSNARARIKKILSIPEHKEWINSGGKIVVHGWYKKNNRWFCETILI